MYYSFLECAVPTNRSIHLFESSCLGQFKLLELASMI